MWHSCCTHSTSCYRPELTCSGQLRSGEYELQLWQGMEMKDSQDEMIAPNPTIFASNNPYHKAVKLRVKFQETSVPMFYPSTNHQSCTVMLKWGYLLCVDSLNDVRDIYDNYTGSIQQLLKWTWGKTTDVCWLLSEKIDFTKYDYSFFARSTLVCWHWNAYHCKKYYALWCLPLQNVPFYIQSIPWNNLSKMIEIYLFLGQLEDSIADIPVEVCTMLIRYSTWHHSIHVVQHLHSIAQVALRLLDSDFPDEHVRAFAVRALEDLPDEHLEDFLLQLVQVFIVMWPAHDWYC